MLTLKNVSFDVKDDGGEKGIIRDLSPVSYTHLCGTAWPMCRCFPGGR